MPTDDPRDTEENAHIALECTNEREGRYLLKFMGLHAPLPVVAEVGVDEADLRHLRAVITDTLGDRHRLAHAEPRQSPLPSVTLNDNDRCQVQTDAVDTDDEDSDSNTDRGA